MQVPTLSAMETLHFHAQLRLARRATADEMGARMREVLRTMGLWKVRNTQVRLPMSGA